MTAQEKLNQKIHNNFHVCVGLDTVFNKIPEYLRNSKNPVVEFNKIVIENTYESAAAFKINFAFYEKDGLLGIENLLATIELIPKDILIIGDAKRGDIGNTSQMYAESIFNYFKCDAVTLHPYMGFDSLEPFLQFKDKLNFILALTSNKGAEDFEKLKLNDDKFVFQRIIEKVKEWNQNKNCGIVFGATNSKELEDNINLFGDLPVLLPGVGAQGGSLEDVVKIFDTANNQNYLINISRSLIYCDNSSSFPETIRSEIEKMNSIIQSLKRKQ
ncbi:MAG: orotidine-5'-phosphate decarboxylase [Melioribacter sp.]|uniref:orotidine-5'-phosphate decarboxylase n=1 Tax=Rosettibacter primus TaxID=3111523 RepID=UPI00247BFA3D|nr:orotidine-5'-phosphate decarboxylase [Melioribacter sp.]